MVLGSVLELSINILCNNFSWYNRCNLCRGQVGGGSGALVSATSGAENESVSLGCHLHNMLATGSSEITRYHLSLEYKL